MSHTKLTGVGFSWAVVWGAACSGGGVEVVAAKSAGPVHYEARAQDPFVEVSFKASGGVQEFEVEIKGARPGVKHVIRVDGTGVGSMTTGLDGEADFELVEGEGRFFPPTFPSVGSGTRVAVGEIVELTLQPLVKLVHLTLEIQGANGLAGKASFKMEKLGEAITREFQVKLENAPAETLQPVTLGGVALGDIEIDDEGEGKLEFSETDGDPFPAGFVEPKPGAELKLGELYTGQLQDALE